LYKRSEHGTERNKRLIDFGLSLFRLKLGHPLAAVIGQFERPAAVCDQSRTVVIVSRSQPASNTGYGAKPSLLSLLSLGFGVISLCYLKLVESSLYLVCLFLPL